MDLLQELWAFLRVRKKFWLMPIILVLGLMIALAIVAGGAGGLSPLIYALF